MMMGSWRLQTLAKVLFSRGPLELSLTFRCAKWVRALKPKDSCQTFCARTHSRHAIPLWPFKGSILCRSLMELYLLTESFVYEKTPNHNTKKNRSLGEGTTLTLHTPPLMFGCFLQFLWCEYSSVFFFQSLELRHWAITFSVTPGNILFLLIFTLHLASPAWLTANLGFSSSVGSNALFNLTEDQFTCDIVSKSKSI